ncbi:MAG: AbrB/MazE/SpoVT family DNA-binding domain-containing protein [bacterium]|nr:AbrB/MazE/SpoVT family DNA-binding domain-containing protein [bacterium]
MITTMDAAGRLVVPKAIREEAGLRPGEPLEVTVHDGRVEIVTAPRQVRIRERNGIRIAEPAGSYETLSEQTVRKTRDRLRGDRKPR